MTWALENVRPPRPKHSKGPLPPLPQGQLAISALPITTAVRYLPSVKYTPRFLSVSSPAQQPHKGESGVLI